MATVICSKEKKSCMLLRIRIVASTKILIHALPDITLHCNPLLTGLPKYLLDRLQNIVNAAARVIWFFFYFILTILLHCS